MTDKLDVLCKEYNLRIDKDYTMSQLLQSLGFRVHYDNSFTNKTAQIIVSDCHGNYEMTHSLDSRYITVPEMSQTTKPLIATLLASWLDLKVTDKGEYKPSMTMHTNINMMSGLDADKQASIQALAKQVLLPDKYLLTQIDKSACTDPEYLNYLSAKISRKHKTSFPLAFRRVTETVNNYYPVDINKL